MANTRRQDRQRAAALHLLHRGRYGVREVARILGLPKSTVHDWARQGAAGIQNARLRDIAQVAIDGALLSGAEERWQGLRTATLEFADPEEPEEAAAVVRAALAEAPATGSGCGCCTDCGDSCEGDCCDLCGMGQPTGAMVAFFLSQVEAEALALPPDDVEGRVEPPEDLHLTLAFLGDAADVKDPQRLARVVAGFAAVAPPMAAVVSGVGRFAVGDRALYASVDAPDLPAWRQRLVEHLDLAGYEHNRTHGFTPHVTLAYPTGKVQMDVRPLKLRFATLTLALGGQRYEYPLEGQAAVFAERSGGADDPRGSPAKPTRESRVERARTQGVGERARPPGTDQEDGMQPEVDVGPPLMDRLYLEAIHRWFNLVRAEVPHHRALAAVRRIDPDFDLSPGQVARAYHALGKGQHPVKLGEPPTTKLLAYAAVGVLKPPVYVEATYKLFELRGDRFRLLQRSVTALATDACLRGLSERRGHRVKQLPEELESAVAAQVDTVAGRVAEDFNRALAHEVYVTWVSAGGAPGTRRQLEESVASWAEERANEWAADLAEMEAERWMIAGDAAADVTLK